MVFKLVEINNIPKIKLSQEIEKTTIPCMKQIYRFYGDKDSMLIDIIFMDNDEVPKAGKS